MAKMIKLTHWKEDHTILIREDLIAKVAHAECDPGTEVLCQIAHPGEPAWDWCTVRETPAEILAMIKGDAPETLEEAKAAVASEFIALKRQDGSAEKLRRYVQAGSAESNLWNDGCDTGIGRALEFLGLASILYYPEEE